MDSDKFKVIKHITEQAIPFNRELGLTLLNADDGKATLRFDFQEKLVGNFLTHVLHGGVISSVLDVVGGTAVMSTFDRENPLHDLGTVDLRVDYLRPGSGAYFIATGQVMRPGRILSAVRMELHNDQNDLIAIGTAIYRASRKARESPPNP
ncbi:MAG: thioesterase family protein [bacterium]